MSGTFSFSGLVPSKAEVLKKYGNLDKEVEKLVKSIADLNDRLAAAQVRSNELAAKEKNITEEFEMALAEGVESKESNTSLDKVRKELENTNHEVAGLKNLLPKKEQELKEVKHLLALKDYNLSLSNLHPLFDEYNKQAAELAETLKKMFYEFLNCQKEARNAGETFSPPVNFVYGRGVPEEIPAIVFDSVKTTTAEKYHWNYHLFNQDYVNSH
jgi:predicted  nucleic acid-binding Zn-ribbon protein